jgi:uncharacterized membrane protein
MSVNITTSESNQVNVPEQGTNIINVGWSERVTSAAVGGYLLGAGLKNLGRKPIRGLLQTLLGGYFLYRGSSGNCMLYTAVGKEGTEARHADSVNIRTSMVVNQPKAEVYQIWRRLENLPKFMKHLLTVAEIDSKRSHWEAVLPGSIATLKWEAEIVKEIPDELIGWQSVANSTIENAGKVEFKDAPNGGTELDIIISYRPPAGDIGAGIAKLMNPVFRKVITDDVMNFKKYMESLQLGSADTANTFVGQSAMG